MAKRTVERNGSLIDEVSVHWQALTEDDATWEVVGDIARHFPDFSLEDKSILEGEGNDTIRRSARVPKPNSRYLD